MSSLFENHVYTFTKEGILMKLFKLLVLSLFVTLSLNQNLYAEIYKCVGTDEDGSAVKVIYDEDALTLNVNGSSHKLISATNNEKGLATEDYTTEDGKKVYDSLVVEGKDKIKLYQFDSATDKSQSKISLDCL